MFSPIKYQPPNYESNKKASSPSSQQQQQHRQGGQAQVRAATPSSSSSSSPQAFVAAMKSPVSVSSLSVQRLRAITKLHHNLQHQVVAKDDRDDEEEGLIEFRDPVTRSLNKEMSHRFLNNSGSTNSKSPSSRIQRSLSTSKKAHDNSTSSKTRTAEEEQQDHNNANNDNNNTGLRVSNDASCSSFQLAQDLSALMRGAPVPRLFTQTQSVVSQFQKQQQEQQQERERAEKEDRQQEDSFFDLTSTSIIHSSSSPHSSSSSSSSLNRKKQQLLETVLGGGEQKSLILSRKHAKFLDEELSLRLQYEKSKEQQQQQQNQSHHRPNSKKEHKQEEEEDDDDNNVKQQSRGEPFKHDGETHTTTISQTAMFHCRDLAFKLADKIAGLGHIGNSNNNNTSSSSSSSSSSSGTNGYGQLLRRVIEILCTYGEEQHERTIHVKRQLSEMKANQETVLSTAREQLELEMEERNRNKELEKQKSLFETMMESSRHADEEDPEAEKKRLLAQVVSLQGELASEKEQNDVLTKTKKELQETIDSQLEAQAAVAEEHRDALRSANAEYDELESRFNLKRVEIKELKEEAKDLEADLDEQLWLGTIEVESAEVAQQLLRKHCKDTEARCSLLSMRLRQEQEQNTKLRRKLAKVLENDINESTLTEYFDGQLPQQQPATTPRPNKEAIVRAVPQLGKAQAGASTASLMESLLATVQLQEDRLKIEARSWKQAQAEADRILDERKGRSFESVGVQTEKV